MSDEDFAKMVQSSKVPKLTEAERMRKLYNIWVLGGFQPIDLITIKWFKRKSRKSWKTLGLSALEEFKIKNSD